MFQKIFLQRLLHLTYGHQHVFVADSHENDADVSVSFTHRPRYAALYLVTAAVRAVKIPVQLWSRVASDITVFSQILLDHDDDAVFNVSFFCVLVLLVKAVAVSADTLFQQLTLTLTINTTNHIPKL